MKSPVMLIVLDGFGIAPKGRGNAESLAKTPVLDELKKKGPFGCLRASGEDVGLPRGQMGNSEVGHLNIGAGRIMYQNLSRITKDVKDGSFFKNPVLREGMTVTKSRGKSLHLMGLYSFGGVHSHGDHLFALMDLAKEMGLSETYVHAITDGRDVAPDTAYGDLKILLERMEEKDYGRLATVCGRYYAMDRDKRWERTKRAYDCYRKGVGLRAPDILKEVKREYEKGVYDEFLPPLVVDERGIIGDGDTVIFFNFRPDRARQITRSLLDPNFDGFPREEVYHGYYATMTEYDPTIPNTHVVYEENIPKETLGEYLSEQGKTQLRIAETEKYAHVTFFLNGGVEVPFPGEDRILVPSPKVATYDLLPEMSAFEVTDQVVKAIQSKKYDFIMLNFANPDMVGHTGVIPAAVKAVETVDTCLGRILDALKDVGGAALITADHGNCEVMLTEDGEPVTSHTVNPVPLYGFGVKGSFREGRLADLAPTILELMGLKAPPEMTGKSLLCNEEVL